MASFFRKLTASVTATVSEVAKSVGETVGDVAAAISLDNLQEKYGDPDGRKALYDGLDLTYVAPRLIGAWRVCWRDSRVVPFAGGARTRDSPGLARVAVRTRGELVHETRP